MTQALSRLNFRDIGGMPTREGGLLRPGMIYRSEGPASFAAVHRAELAALDIRLVCDLRSQSERDKDPNDWIDTGRLFNLDVTADLRVKSNGGWQTLRHDQSEAAVRGALTTNYATIPFALRPHLRRLVAAIVEGETPVLIHCTAGKDRTGVLVAVLLKAVGVADDVIAADYLRSDVFARNQRIRGDVEAQFADAFGFRPGAALIDAMIGVDVRLLDAAFAAITAEWGGIEPYFAAADIDAGLLARFRRALIAAR